ncbi:hypothetical protein K2173_021064 [Erythroxylum novogranatense]|uniref:ABC transporter domain-containing protein n=1 Tax=Erythroxylum novogranatense TaxID=1862640 RepID=A0AAV8TPV2_9ROSI|nr:hypothetical protein K2173_021064 [Erythroxylum novogranatense]
MEEESTVNVINDNDMISGQATTTDRNWRSESRRQMSWKQIGKNSSVFQRNPTRKAVEEEEELQWAALERLPTFDQMRKGIMKQRTNSGKIFQNEVNVTKLRSQERKLLIENMIKTVEKDHEKFLRRLRHRTDRVGCEIPTVEVRFQNLSVEAQTYVGKRSVPSLTNSVLNKIEGFLKIFGFPTSKNRILKILHDVNGLIKPSRMVLLLGPPSSGRTTLLKTLAGKLEDDLKVSGKVSYCGHEFSEFVSQKTCAYISQHDLHFGEMTVRETLDFAGRCLGVGGRYELLCRLLKLEKEAGVRPDLEVDAFMKATAMAGQENNLITDYVIKILGLETCADIVVGNEMRRGISGGQKKRVTIGEMLVGAAKVILMDEISTGLDSSTTFQIINIMRQMVHIMDVTTVISLLQPAPETYELFDDIILLSEGQIVYQGPKEHVLGFFEHMGFKCPERKGVADYLLEVTSRKDQEQYWNKKNQTYRYVSVPEFVVAFNSFHIGQKLSEDLRVPFDKSRIHPAALVKEKYGISNWELFRACFSREWLLVRRSYFIYIFKAVQLTVMAVIALTVFMKTKKDINQRQYAAKLWGALFFSLTSLMFNGVLELAITASRLPVFFKQRDFLFYPSWAFVLPIWLLRLPVSLIDTGIWVIFTYYTIGFAPSASRFFRQFLAFFAIHQTSLSLFRLIAAVGRTRVLASILGISSLMLLYVLGGFIVSKNDVKSWMVWGFYISPLMYGQNALGLNEFLDDRWNTPTGDPGAPTLGVSLLKERGMFTTEFWFWACIGALFGFSLLYNAFFIITLAYSKPPANNKAAIVDEQPRNKGSFASSLEVSSKAVRNAKVSHCASAEKNGAGKMVLPFQPLSLAFNHVNYYVDMPAEMRNRGLEQSRLQLLQDVSGAFRPGILTALVGDSGAGKTTIMDVLAGRKTGGYIEGIITMSGYPKNQATFARVSGYCEQNDIHSPFVTVEESLLYSAMLRLSAEVGDEAKKMFVEEVMELVELSRIRNAIVGIPGETGLSKEQRKRLTIAVELVANPSIIFMDEPTSGLDARAAAIVMRTVKSTVSTGRTVVCTIHQPSIDIFEAFDELLLMKRGGQMIYAGPLGRHSDKLVEYFEAVPGIPKIKQGYNPANWVLEVSSIAVESQLGIDFAKIYAASELYRNNQDLIEMLSTPPPGSQDLYFPTTYAQGFKNQCVICFWKQKQSYWRNADFNASRFAMTMAIGIVFGAIFWNSGSRIKNEQDLKNLLGATYAAAILLGSSNAGSIQSVVAMERIVFYRERAAGMYSELPYAFAQVAIETIYVAILTFAYSALLFFTIGFDWTLCKFLYFYYFIFMCFTYYSMYGMMIIALTPGHQFAAIVMSFLFSLWNLFSGFQIPRPLLPAWWRWYYWGSPVAWTVYGIVTSQVGDKTSLLEMPNSVSVPVNVYINKVFGYDYDFLTAVIVAHVGWVLVFFFAFAYGIRFLNFQRR